MSDAPTTPDSADLVARRVVMRRSTWDALTEIAGDTWSPCDVAAKAIDEGIKVILKANLIPKKKKMPRRR